MIRGVTAVTARIETWNFESGVQFANHKVSASLLVTSSGIDIAVMLVAWFLSSVMFCF